MAQAACIGIASIAHSKLATATAIFWQATVAPAIPARTMSPTLQNALAQQNAALTRSSNTTGHVANVLHALSGHRVHSSFYVGVLICIRYAYNSSMRVAQSHC